uniref:Uncharacterized protein n=1 Tax=Amphimedon queenslandica TaxID=400682 RepID=A0A1X7ST15_AMPQE
LEEVIDQKNEKIELLRGQLDSITASQEGGDVGALRRQLLKMEQSMQVKDRFCSLLSDSVNQLQKELQDSKKGSDETDFGVGQNRADSGISSLSKEHEVKERNLRKMIDELQGQVERERNEKREALTQADESCQKLIEKQAELEGLQSRLDDSNLYTQTLLQDKMALKDQLDNARRNSGNSSEIKDVSYYMTQMENKDAQIDRLKQMLEEAQYKYALAESKRDNLQVGDLEEK